MTNDAYTNHETDIVLTPITTAPNVKYVDLRGVSERALMARINRKLRKDLSALRKTRGGCAQIELGDFYVVDYELNSVTDTFVDIEDLGRELGVLRHYERLAP